MKGRAPEMKGLWKAQDEDQGWWWHHDQGSEGCQVSSVAATDALAGKRAARRPQSAVTTGPVVFELSRSAHSGPVFTYLSFF